jgi:hypothetical protein
VFVAAWAAEGGLPTSLSSVVIWGVVFRLGLCSAVLIVFQI